jgi:dTDP-4-dehydrorhamnose reductase
MSRVLVFGGRGWIGRALVPALRRAGHTVRAPRHDACDVADPRAVERVVAEFRPDAIVNAAAANTGTADEATLSAVNVGGARHAAASAERADARLVHVSTDLVLDGRSPPYADDATPCPVNAYGRTKAAGEAAVLAACPRAVVVRASHVFDPSTPDPSLRGFIGRLRAGEPCRLYVDEIRCPISRPALAAALAELVTADVGGTLNVAGSEPLSRFEYGTLLLEHFRVPRRENVQRARAADLAEPRPLDLTLDVSRARSILATPLGGVRDALRRDEVPGVRAGRVTRIAGRPDRRPPKP